MEKGQIAELLIVGIAVLIGIAMFSPIQNICHGLAYPLNGSGVATSSNVSALAQVFLSLVPFAYILVVFALGIAVVIKVLK